MENIWAIYECGYVYENGLIREDLKIVSIYGDDAKLQWVPDNHFAVQQYHDGISYVDIEDTKIIGPWFANKDHTIKCKISHLQDHTLNRDLDSRFFKGFSVGRGKQLYFLYIWHKSGHCTVYSTDNNTRSGRYISGDSEVTIHFNECAK